jgi:hypothetical protein
MKELDMLTQHCEFNHKNDCYVLLAVSRKKDTPEITNSKEIIFRKIIKKKEDVARKYLQILAETKNYKDENGKSFPFYIYVSLNARDSYKATHILLQDILHWFYEESKGTDRSIMFKRVDGYFYSALMKPEARTTSQKYFMIDYDEKIMIDGFRKILALNKVEVIFEQETKNGYHIKVKPFNTKTLEHLSEIYPFEIKKDANLFVQYIKNDGGD